MTPLDRIASDAYSQTHLLLITGVIYLALGVEQVLGLVAGVHGADEHAARLTWSASVALHGGAALFLGGRLLFLRLTGQPVPPAQRAVVVLVLLLLPLGCCCRPPRRSACSACSCSPRSPSSGCPGGAGRPPRPPPPETGPSAAGSRRREAGGYRMINVSPVLV
ncbi:low temperature requirement protein A [Micromonospora sp. NPDC005299]|uniref:low temperature requirement protein A n=1 Tax=Micromonospora sp. NPDC005299 TaxID=3364231 RepID=UPI0036ACC3BA